MPLLHYIYQLYHPWDPTSTHNKLDPISTHNKQHKSSTFLLELVSVKPRKVFGDGGSGGTGTRKFGPRGLTSGQQRGICFVFSVFLPNIFHFY